MSRVACKGPITDRRLLPMTAITEMSTELTDTDLDLLDAYWRAANYLSVGQIYLLDNPLLREPLRPEHIKPRLLGHWGTTPGLNLVYTHMNRLIRAHDLDAIFITGPGHGGPALVANAYLEGTYSETYHHIDQDEAGMLPAVPRVLVSRRHPESCRGRGSRLHSRRRRARLRPGARLRRRVRQSGPARLLRDRRRRGGDRAAGGKLALQQVHRSGPGRRGAADAAPERLQDRQPGRARPHTRTHAGEPA